LCFDRCSLMCVCIALKLIILPTLVFAFVETGTVRFESPIEGNFLSQPFKAWMVLRMKSEGVSKVASDATRECYCYCYVVVAGDLLTCEGREGRRGPAVSPTASLA
jgi:hypothetical protein